MHMPEGSRLHVSGSISKVIVMGLALRGFRCSPLSYGETGTVSTGILITSAANLRLFAD